MDVKLKFAKGCLISHMSATTHSELFFGKLCLSGNCMVFRRNDYTDTRFFRKLS